MPRYLLAFDSTHAAMAANKALAAVGPAVIPTPRFEAEDAAEARALAASVPAAHGLAALYADEAGEYTLVEKL